MSNKNKNTLQSAKEYLTKLKSVNQPTEQNNKDKKPKSPFFVFLQQFAVSIAVFFILGYVYTQMQSTSSPATKTTNNEISFGQMVDLVQSGTVTALTVKDETVTATLSDKSIKKTKRDTVVPITEQLTQYGVTSDQLKKLPIETKTGLGNSMWLAILLNLLGPVVIFVVIIFLFMRFVRGGSGGGMGGMSFGMSRAKLVEPDTKKNTFADVAGNREAKSELAEVVDFLKHPQKYLDIGAKIPTGVLLTGAPGTGKTLLARAIAGEAEVPFFYLSGSEFVEMFVGVGASRVRDLFDQAKKVSPAIVFIDEIDAVGRHRGIGIGGGNDEREQTLNQILVEMDGFEPSQTVIIIAATNRPDVLDEALLRPGRFDRRIILELPDRRDRLEILNIHAKKRKVAESCDLSKMAERTVGFSGADLESLVNEAALLAARESRSEIEQRDFISASERVMMGPERQSLKRSDKEQKLVAYHEAGHAVVASVLPNADPVHKVTIVPRGHAGGFTMKIALDDRKLMTRSEYLDDIAMSMAGGMAERIFLDGDFTTGPSGDIEQSTKLARAMVMRWGMSDAIGPVALISSDGRPIAGVPSHNEYSESVSTIVDSEVKHILQTGQQRAAEVLQQYRALLDALATKLLEVETLEQAEFNDLIIKFGLKPKLVAGK